VTDTPTWEDLTEPYPSRYDDPPLDRLAARLNGEPAPIAGGELLADWMNRGYVILRDVIPEADLAAYRKRWWADNGPRQAARSHGGRAALRNPGGYDDTGYETVDEMRAILCSPRIDRALATLFDGASFGLHLCLSGWVSTTRDWHQDDYLNEPDVRCWYAAAWVPLAPISTDSGPFEVVPGSHRWGRLMRRELVLEHADPAERGRPDWPATTERFCVPAIRAEIERRSSTVEFLYPEPGDVVLWHAALVHRGSTPTNPEALRPALIGHYSLDDRRDFAPYPLVRDRPGSMPYWRFGR
jgi:hypothetical protein